jgi:hypothetical protein
MPEQTENQNPLDLWRQYITNSERQWNSFFKDVLGTDTVSNSMNAWVESSLTIQRMVADQLERLYTTFNIPSHSDLVALGERMKAIEDSMARLESAVVAGVPAASRARTATKKRIRPPRTKRPANANGVAARA